MQSIPLGCFGSGFFRHPFAISSGGLPKFWGKGGGRKEGRLFYYTHLEKQSSLSVGDAGRRLVPSNSTGNYADLFLLNSQDLMRHAADSMDGKTELG